MGKFPEGTQSGHGKPTQCTAISKRRKRAGEAYPRCRRYATVGAKHCRLHGGEQENKPALERITHGLRSAYVRIDDVEEITTKIAQARTAEGRQEMLARNTSLLQYRLEQVPLEPEHMAVAAGGAEAVRRQLETLADLDDTKASQRPVNFILHDFAKFEATPILVRTIDAPRSMIKVRNREEGAFLVPYVEDSEGRFAPAVECTDEESGAIWYDFLPLKSHEH